MKGWIALPSPSGYPAFVWLLRRSCPTEGNTSAQNSHVAVTPTELTYDDAQLNQPHTYMHLLPCLSRWQVRRSVHIQNKLFPQLGSGDVEFCTFVHNNISVVQLKPTKKYLQRQLVLLAFATAKSALYRRSNFFSGWVPSPPKNVGSSGQQMSWHRVESSFFLRHGEGKRRRACLRLVHAQVENEIIWREAAPGASEGRALTLIAHVSYGESTFKRNRPSRLCTPTHTGHRDWFGCPGVTAATELLSIR